MPASALQDCILDTWAILSTNVGGVAAYDIADKLAQEWYLVEEQWLSEDGWASSARSSALESLEPSERAWIHSLPPIFGSYD